MSLRIIFIIAFFSINLFSQEIGLVFDGVGKNTDKKFYFPVPLSGLDFFFILKAPPYRFEGAFGYQLLDVNYSGWEGSLYLLYDVLPPLYAIAGINYHSNRAGNSNSEGFYARDLIMPGLGAGVDVLKWFSVELIYHTLFKKVTLYYTRDPAKDYQKEETSLTGVLKFNLKLRFGF